MNVQRSAPKGGPLTPRRQSNRLTTWAPGTRTEQPTELVGRITWTGRHDNGTPSVILVDGQNKSWKLTADETAGLMRNTIAVFRWTPRRLLIFDMAGRSLVFDSPPLEPAYTPTLQQLWDCVHRDEKAAARARWSAQMAERREALG